MNAQQLGLVALGERAQVHLLSAPSHGRSGGVVARGVVGGHDSAPPVNGSIDDERDHQAGRFVIAEPVVASE